MKKPMDLEMEDIIGGPMTKEASIWDFISYRILSYLVLSYPFLSYPIYLIYVSIIWTCLSLYPTQPSLAYLIYLSIYLSIHRRFCCLAILQIQYYATKIKQHRTGIPALNQGVDKLFLVWWFSLPSIPAWHNRGTSWYWQVDIQMKYSQVASSFNGR